MTSFKLEKWRESEKDSTEALKLDPKNIKAWWRRAMARRSLGNYEGARMDLEKGLLFEPDEILLKDELKKLDLEMKHHSIIEKNSESRSLGSSSYHSMDEIKKETLPVSRQRRLVPIREIHDQHDADSGLGFESESSRKSNKTLKETHDSKKIQVSSVEVFSLDLCRPENSLDFERTLRSLKSQPDKLFEYFQVSLFSESRDD